MNVVALLQVVRIGGGRARLGERAQRARGCRAGSASRRPRCTGPRERPRRRRPGSGCNARRSASTACRSSRLKTSAWTRSCEPSSHVDRVAGVEVDLDVGRGAGRQCRAARGSAADRPEVSASARRRSAEGRSTSGSTRPGSALRPCPRARSCRRACPGGRSPRSAGRTLLTMKSPKSKSGVEVGGNSPVDRW